MEPERQSNNVKECKSQKTPNRRKQSYLSQLLAGGEDADIHIVEMIIPLKKFQSSNIPVECQIVTEPESKGDEVAEQQLKVSVLGPDAGFEISANQKSFKEENKNNTGCFSTLHEHISAVNYGSVASESLRNAQDVYAQDHMNGSINFNDGALDETVVPVSLFRRKRKRKSYTIDANKSAGHSSMDPLNSHATKRKTDDYNLKSLPFKYIGSTISYNLNTKLAEDVDLARNLGIAASELTPDKIIQRKKKIQNKLGSGHYSLQVEEEYDVHCRAQSYVASVVPDPDYYIVPGTATSSICTACDMENKENMKAIEKVHTSTARGRKRRFSGMSDYVVPSPYSKLYPEISNCVTLSDGTQLLKPPVKLVELVAETINDSPDGMLQVQQVYMVLQSRYPFFSYLDKSSTTSWRSSIRHALYQKWFHKIQFGADRIHCKGCYWALNRQHQPKEWVLPTAKLLGDGLCINGEERFTADVVPSSPSLLGSQDIEDESPANRSMFMEIPPLDMECVGDIAYTLPPSSHHGYKDSDPTLNLINYTQVSEGSQEYLSCHSPTGSFSGMSYIDGLQNESTTSSEADSGYCGPSAKLKPAKPSRALKGPCRLQHSQSSTSTDPNPSVLASPMTFAYVALPAEEVIGVNLMEATALNGSTFQLLHPDEEHW